MHTSFKSKQLCVAITLAMSAIGLTACGGGSSGGSGGSSVPIVKEYDAFVEGSLGGTAFAGETVTLPKLSKNGLPLKYKHRENSEEFCTLQPDGYSVKLKPNTENKVQQCNLWVDNQGGNARFKPISTAHVIDIYPVCEDGQRNGEKSHLCIPATTTINPISNPATNVNSGLTFTVTGYNLKDKLSSLTIQTDACDDITRSKEVATDYEDIDSFAISCTPDTAGTFDLMISDGTTQLLKSQINVELPTVTGGNNVLLKTGSTTCGNDTESALDCTEAALGDWYGLKQDGEVQAGADFNYSKKQYTNPTTKQQETCIYDNVTGLLWEAKTDDGGLRDKDWTYTWYNTNSATNGGNQGDEGEDTCGGTLAASGNKCNTQAYIQKLNEVQYCGYDDWRLPQFYELLNLVDYGNSQPAINSIFANTNFTKVNPVTGELNIGIYASDNRAAYSPETLTVDYRDGFMRFTRYTNKPEPILIRAVRSD